MGFRRLPERVRGVFRVGSQAACRGWFLTSSSRHSELQKLKSSTIFLMTYPRTPNYLNSRLPGYVTIGYIEPRTHYLGNWSP